MIGLISLYSYSKIMTNMNYISDKMSDMAIGSYAYTRYPLDLFPILKWLPYISVGILIGNIFVLNDFSNILPNNKLIDSVEFIGRNTLILYIIHIIPCIYLISKKYKR